MPDPDRLLTTLRRAVEACRTTPGRRGRLVEPPDVGDALVAGDLHGHLENFKALLDRADLACHPRRHLVLQELVHGPRRDPAGGDQSHRLLDLFAALKCQFPDRVHMLLGNHELSQWTRRAIVKNEEDLNELFERGVRTAYGERAGDVLAAYDRLFAALPIAVRLPNRVFLSHSLPSAARLAAWEPAMICREGETPEDYKLGGAVHAVVWGRDTSAPTAELYLKKVDADLLVSGHIPCDDGHLVPNDRQLILDCKDDRACACLVPADRPLTQAELLKGLVRLRGDTASASP
jgi:hypothetical protein